MLNTGQPQSPAADKGFLSTCNASPASTARSAPSEDGQTSAAALSKAGWMDCQNVWGNAEMHFTAQCVLMPVLKQSACSKGTFKNRTACESRANAVLVHL